MKLTEKDKNLLNELDHKMIFEVYTEYQFVFGAYLDGQRVAEISFIPTDKLIDIFSDHIVSDLFDIDFAYFGLRKGKESLISLRLGNLN
jgi:hypothetical protein